MPSGCVWGMSAYSWQQSAATGGLIKADPILEMRIALDQVLGAPPSGYTAGLAQGQAILAAHIQELRDRFIAAWGIDIRWFVTDQLGTPRMVFDKSGSLSGVSRHDYLPFGEDLYAGTGGRSNTQGYSVGDGARQKFTLKERDNETGLDFFGARYYRSTQGRFISPDRLLSSGHLENPQTWNRYPYTLNNPLTLVDPTGLFTIGAGVSHDEQEQIIAAYDTLVAALGKLKSGSKAYKSIERSLNRLGKPGQANGIVVTIGKPADSGAAGETDVNRIDKGTVRLLSAEMNSLSKAHRRGPQIWVMKVFTLMMRSTFSQAPNPWRTSGANGTQMIINIRQNIMPSSQAQAFFKQ